MLAWGCGVWGQEPAWRLEQQDAAPGWYPAPHPHCQGLPSALSLGMGLGSSLGLPTPRGREEVGRPQAVARRPSAGAGSRVLLMTRFSHGGAQPLPMLEPAPGAPILE